MLTEAVVLAGGQATRLGELARDTPKIMLPVAGRPFIDHLVWNVRRHGVRRIVFAVGRHSDQIAAHIGDGSSLGIEAVWAEEPAPLGTGGALALAARRVSGDDVLVLNGDTLFDTNYLDLALARRTRGADGALALRRVEDASRYGSARLEGERLVALAEKQAGGTGLVSGGVYVLSRRALDELPEGAFSLETEVLAPLAAAGRLVARTYSGLFIDIGVPDSLAASQALIADWRHKPAVFLDRDGVINVDTGWAHTPELFEWIPGAPQAVKRINDAGFLAIVVTNQAGIARGLYTEDDFHAFTAWIDTRLAEYGAHVDATYFCPHHPTAGRGEYRRECRCRKPGPEMFERAIRDWDVDVERSVAIGDRDKDLTAAAAAGVRAMKFEGGDLDALVAGMLESVA